MSAILIIFFLPDRLKWKHVYHFSNIQTLFMIFLVKALALQSYNKCDYFLVTRNNLDEKKKTARGNISIININEYTNHSSHTADNKFECFIF